MCSNFQTNLKSSGISLVLLYIALWLVLETRAPSFQPIRIKTKTNRDLVARVFPRFKQFTSFRFVLF